MARIKHLIGAEKAEQLYALKDTLKRASRLNGDPMRMNRTQFEAYLSAKAEQLILDYTQEKGDDPDSAYRKAQVYLTVLDHKWREEAKRLSELESTDA